VIHRLADISQVRPERNRKTLDIVGCQILIDVDRLRPGQPEVLREPFEADAVLHPGAPKS
jgi:hypothetical protein